MVGSVVVGTNLVLQKSYAPMVIIDIGQFNTLENQFRKDVSTLFVDPPTPDRDKQLATLFDNYEQGVNKLMSTETTTTTK